MQNCTGQPWRSEPTQTNCIVLPIAIWLQIGHPISEHSNLCQDVRLPFFCIPFLVLIYIATSSGYCWLFVIDHRTDAKCYILWGSSKHRSVPKSELWKVGAPFRSHLWFDGFIFPNLWTGRRWMDMVGWSTRACFHDGFSWVQPPTGDALRASANLSTPRGPSRGLQQVPWWRSMVHAILPATWSCRSGRYRIQVGWGPALPDLDCAWTSKYHGVYFLLVDHKLFVVSGCHYGSTNRRNYLYSYNTEEKAADIYDDSYLIFSSFQNDYQIIIKAGWGHTCPNIIRNDEDMSHLE